MVQSKFDLETFEGQQAAKAYLRRLYLDNLEAEHDEATDLLQSMTICYNTRISFQTLEEMDFLVFYTTFGVALERFNEILKKANEPEPEKKKPQDDTAGRTIAIESVAKHLERTYGTKI